jgi:hypothetical protein
MGKSNTMAAGEGAFWKDREKHAAGETPTM